MPITWSADDARAPPPQRPRQLRHAGPRGRHARPPPLRGAAATRTGRSRHLEPAGFAGFSNRVGDPVALEYPTTGAGDYRIPALTVEHADGSTVLDLAYARAPHRGRASRACGRPPARRPTSRPTTRPTRSSRHARRRPERPRASTSPTRSSATARSSPAARGSRNDGTTADPPDRRHERRPSTCPTRAGSSSS